MTASWALRQIPRQGARGPHRRAQHDPRKHGRGQEGLFFELGEAAGAKERRGVPLTPLDFKFHFFPWWKSPDYELDLEGVEITDANDRYFTKLASEHGIHLSDRQKAWYVKKAETQQEDMQREYPSTPGEAFEASVEGAYYGAEIAKAEQQARIGRFPAIAGHPVNTAWDIGVGDYTVIWFFQIIAGRFRIAGYFQNSGEGMPYYLDEMERMARERGWDLKGGQHCLPHDGGVTEWGTGRTREEQMRQSASRSSWSRSSASPMASTQCGPFYRSATSTPARLPMASKR